MKYIVIIILVLISTNSFSQGFLGSWEGEMHGLEIPIHVKMNVMVHNNTMIGAMLFINEIYQLTDSSFHGTDLHLMTSKDQMIHRRKNETTLCREVKFNGALTTNKNQLNGQLIMDGKSFDVELFREGKPIFRPQEPQKPYPYCSEDVTFFNEKDKVILAGTLTLPNKEGKFPAVIIKSGSTPLDRDGESNFHRPFLLLADYLTRHGIAVLRYDDRGIDRSTGNFEQSTVVDFADDLQAGCKYLASRKEIRGNEIGIIGHSEGGVTASIIASRSDSIKFVVMLAAPGIGLKKVFEDQNELRYKCGDISTEQFEFEKKVDATTSQMMNRNLESKAMFDSLWNFKNEFLAMNYGSHPKNIENDIVLTGLFNDLISIRTNPHFLYNLNVLPSDYIEKLTCPVLSLNGSKDMQVNAKINQKAIRQALLKAGNKDFKILELEGLNHLFQECQTDSMKEASTIEQTFSPKALDIITQWILEHVKD